MPTAEVFGRVAKFWTEIADADATEEQVNLVKRHVQPNGWILDLACGTGRHAVALDAAGYRMVGLDVSTELLKIAKNKAAQAHADLPLVRADLRFLPFQQNAFAAVVSLDQSIGYFSTETDDLVAFKEAKAVLRVGSVLVVDVFNRPQLTQRYIKRPSSARWRDYPSFWLQQTRTITPQGMLCDVWVFRDKATEEQTVVRHVARLFGLAELTGLVEQAELQVQQVLGGYNGVKYGEEANRLIVIACKP